MSKRLKRTLIVYSVLLTMAVVGYVFRYHKIKMMSEEDNLLLAFTSFVYLGLVWEVNRFIHYSLNKWLPFEKSVVIRIILQLSIAGIYMMILRWIALQIFNDKIPDFVRNDSLLLRVIYFIDFIMAISIHLAYISNFFFRQWKLSLQKAERLEKEKTQVQFDNLKTQLNPHFLFNNLTLLDGLIHEQPELASKFLQHLSKVYRYVLQHKDKETVSLQTENEFIEHYIQLIETRFEKGLRIKLDFKEASLEKRIVPVTLQILIENAIKHNTTHPQNPLQIDLFTENGYLVVQNNIQLKSQVESSNKQGLSNLKNLYMYLSEKNVEVLVNDHKFVVKVPLIE